MAKCLSLTAALSFPEPALFQGGPCKKINIYLPEVFQPFGHKFQGNAREFHFFWFCQLCQEVLLPSQPDPPPKHFTNHIVFNNKLLQPIQAPHDTTLGQFWYSFGTTCLLLSDHWRSVPLPYGQQMVILFTKFSLRNSRETIDTAFLVLLKSTVHSSATNFKTLLRCSLVSLTNRASSSLTSKPRVL